MLNRLSGAIGYSILTVLLLLSVDGTYSQGELPPCSVERPAYTDEIWAGSGDRYCLEIVTADYTIGAIGYTQIAAAPDGSLYAVMPEWGQVVRFTDNNDDLLPDTPQVIMENIIWPTGIEHHDGALYITAQGFIYRYDLSTDEQTTLVNDLPAGWTGYPTGGPVIWDGWLYVGAGGDIACTPGRGTIWRVSLDGSEREIYADGIRAPMDLTLFDEKLWTVDTDTDRLLEVIAGADYGACSEATPPPAATYLFEDDSGPIALFPYTADLYPAVANRLFVALRGNIGEVIITGYEVVAIGFDDDGNPVDQVPVLPVNPPHLNISDQRMDIQGSGFYPNHVYGVTADTRGWIYISSGDGRIYGLRPR